MKTRLTRNVSSPDSVPVSARPGPVSLAPYAWIHIMLLHSWDLLMKSFFIMVIMRCNDACLWTMTSCHGICGPSHLSQGDTSVSPWGVWLHCWTCISRVTFNTSYYRCHPLLPSFQLTGGACKPCTCTGEDVPETPASREGMLVGLTHEITRDKHKFRCFCVIYISHRTMFLIAGTIFCTYLSLEPFLSCKGEQSCSSAILRNSASLWFSMLSPHRNCFLEGLPEWESLYLPSYQITVINTAQWVCLNL